MLLGAAVFARDADLSEDGPWFTGPIVAGTAFVLPPGISDVEYYLTFIDTYGVYQKNWTLQPWKPLYSMVGVIYLSTGLFENVDWSMYAAGIHNWKGDRSFTGVGDLNIIFKYSLHKEDKDWPQISLALAEIVPTGNYHHLDPDSFLVDATGQGAWITAFGLRVQKNVKMHDDKWLEWRANFNYSVAPPAPIEGFSVYGGDRTTRGQVHVGDVFFMDLAIEKQLTQNWVFACDAVYVHTNKSTFSGTTEEPVGLPSTEQISIAPAIEYNWSEKMGIIGGIWATVAGRNSYVFASPTIAFNMVF